MKKILLAIALMTGTAALFAGTHTHSTGVAAEKNISATIRSQIRFPEFLLDKQGEHAAAIFFKIAPSGSIKIQTIQSDDETLKTELLSQVGNFKVNTEGLDTRDVYKVVVRFETL
jgi:hypothetical protein